jgi:hypothetical protein
MSTSVDTNNQIYVPYNEKLPASLKASRAT